MEGRGCRRERARSHSRANSQRSDGDDDECERRNDRVGSAVVRAAVGSAGDESKRRGEGVGARNPYNSAIRN